MDRITEVLEGMPARFLPRVLQLIREAEGAGRAVCEQIAMTAIDSDYHSAATMPRQHEGNRRAWEIACSIRRRSGVPLANIEAVRRAAEQYGRPFDSITVRPEYEALARERLSPPE